MAAPIPAKNRSCWAGNLGSALLIDGEKNTIIAALPAGHASVPLLQQSSDKPYNKQKVSLCNSLSNSRACPTVKARLL